MLDRPNIPQVQNVLMKLRSSIQERGDYVLGKFTYADISMAVSCKACLALLIADAL